jgi:tRNA dimethylallyltransferase
LSATPPFVLLLGPTASGKSAAALSLADRLPIEIVSVDSALVYRGLDIGTAKPSAEERQRVRHHLIDLLEPTDAYSAARFVTEARAAIEDIAARGRVAVLTGGTMLYARALTQGLHALPPADPALRARIEDEAARLGWPALHARLAMLDPTTAARLAPTDAQRIQRALEIAEATGRPMSDWLAQQRSDGAAMQPLLTIALEPSARHLLHERIALRFQAMLDAGFLDEVRQLRARGDLDPGLPSMRSVGYRQLWHWLEVGEPGGAPLALGIDAAIAATRQLAKRQLTWLRAMPERLVIDCLAPDARAQVLGAVRGVLRL